MNTDPIAPPTAVTASLPDGTAVRLRPVTPDDRPLIEQGFARLSPRARYHRFLVSSEHLSARQLAYLSEVDHQDHVAWGVIDGDDAVAVGRWVRLANDPTAADVAVTVIDSHQRRGIGRLLLGVLAVSARSRGVRTLHFDVLAENAAMNGLLRSLGAVRTSEEEVVHHVLDVTGVSPPEISDGDLVQALEQARRSYATGLTPYRVPD
jgi:ribosomal protein S18 acetylase RimI-like enzyme